MFFNINILRLNIDDPPFLEPQLMALDFNQAPAIKKKKERKKGRSLSCYDDSGDPLFFMATSRRNSQKILVIFHQPMMKTLGKRESAFYKRVS